MNKVIHNVAGFDKAGPYSHATEAHGLVYFSGVIPLDPATNQLVNSTPTEATHQILKNLGQLLAATGLTYADVLKSTVFLTDMAHYSEVNAVYAHYFGEAPPARSAVAVAALPKGALVEIEVVAARP